MDIAFENRMSALEKENIIKKCYKNLLHLIKDSIINQSITREQLLEKVTFHNAHFYEEAIQRKKGVIFFDCSLWQLGNHVISSWGKMGSY
ncbi:MAG: hypothetical protein LRY68_03730 [Sulfurospirillum sp.]|nr:hypothetical protein [Sulfurospirillum sp.]